MNTAWIPPKLVWKPTPNFQARDNDPDLIVVHDCQGGYAGSVAVFLSQKRPRVSAHLTLKADGSEVTQCVALSDAAWHCCDFNNRSIGVEMEGFAEKGFPDAEWQADAAIVAWLLLQYDLPCQWAKGGQGKGFASHYDLGHAGGGHSDPTTDPAIWNRHVARITAAYDAMNDDNYPTWPGIKL